MAGGRCRSCERAAEPAEPPFYPKQIDFDITLDVLDWLRPQVNRRSRADIDRVVTLVEEAAGRRL